MGEMAAGGLDMLGRIVLHTGKRVERFKREMPVEKLKEMPFYAREPKDFKRAFEGKPPCVIAEIKFASPSEGFLWRDREPSPEEAARVASVYLDSGARALSILTEHNFFAGSPFNLSAVREGSPEAYLLMKDFFVDPYQFDQARAFGADAVLLIVKVLGEGLATMLEEARSRGLSALVEVHDEEELRAAQRAGAEMIGVNSRDLRTLKTDLDVARRLANLGAKDLLIAESGIKTRADLDDLSSRGYKGFLVGTSLMKSQDPGESLKELLRAG